MLPRRDYGLTCTNPVVTENGTVACGHCRACRVRRAREWSVRIMHEVQFHEESVFVTLTYRPETVPADFAIDKVALQLFFKRLRKRLGGHRRIMYFACGEYGETSGRPHYHAIIFGLGACKECRVCDSDHRRRNVAPAGGTDCEVLESAWHFGFVHSGSVTLDSARYTADYVQKDMRSEMYDGRAPPFSLMSKGIGRRWVEANLDVRRYSLGLPRRGKFVAAPRYYAKVIADRYDGQEREVVKWLLGQLASRRKEVVEIDVKSGYELVRSRAQARRNRSSLEGLKEGRL